VPEGDTVHLAAARLRAALAGERLLATDFRLPALATADLAGQVVTEVLARGKHLFVRTDAGVSLHTHLRLQGAWHLYRPGRPWAPPEHDVRVVLRTDPWVAVGYRLPVCELLAAAADQQAVAHLGPDPLGPDWDPDEAVRRLLLDPDRAIGTAILDQAAIAGPGNVYKNELLFLRGVDPWTKVGHVRDLRGLVDLTARLMRANRATGNQVTTGDTRPGRSRWVTDRAGQPCRRCGTTILEAGQDSYGSDRPTYWCPRCQPAAPAAAAVDGRPRTRVRPARLSRGRRPARR
jgi:endonuclease-8